MHHPDAQAAAALPQHCRLCTHAITGEIPGGATLNLEVELLSIKNSPFGSRAKIVEGRVGA